MPPAAPVFPSPASPPPALPPIVPLIEPVPEAVRKQHWLALALCIALCLGIGTIFGTLFRPGEWYAGLAKPFFNPPNWLFAPAWTILYITMGVALWRIWRLNASVDRTRALRMFAVQLALNAAWTPAFFGAHSLSGGLAVILFMALAIIVTIQYFHPLDKMAAWLMAPYLAWVAFATTLNVFLLALNGDF
jgi:tryptophan-rich sensory protein